jgi:type I restriction enzyme S subunit
MEIQKKTPLLRFPEFSGEWVRKSLGEITYKLSVKNKDGIKYPVYSISNVNGFVPQSEQFEGMDSNDRGYDITMYKIVNKETFAYNPARINVGSIGYSYDLHNVIISSLYVCFKTTEVVDDSFLLKYFFSNRFNKSVLSSVEGGVRDYLFYENFSRITLNLPSVSEQQKIASFLTAIDDKLQTLKKKKTLLEQYKKGVMQQIFSQELRFKDDDGGEFPEWEENCGNDLFESISNKKHNSDLPILAITQEHGAIPRDLIDFKISVMDKSIETYKVVQKGDFIISLRSFQGGIEYSNYEGICSPAYIILRPTKELNPDFFRVYFKTVDYIKRLTKNLEGIRDGKMISFKYFSEVTIPTPSVPEQTKIANFLSAIDDKINHTKTQIEKMELYKKGLLQQMFC